MNLQCEDTILKRLYKGEKSAGEVCQQEPGLWNIIAYEKEWEIYPSYLDFLNKNSEMYELKNLEKEIYFALIRLFLAEVPKGSLILDAGGGIGRFTFDLAKMGHKVELVDACKTSLETAQKYIEKINPPYSPFIKEGQKGIKIHWTRAENLSMFADNTFDAVLAIELICYCTKPDKALKELVRVTKKNGLIIVSVEGKYGSMLSDPHIPLAKIPEILSKNLVSIKNYLYVHYFTEGSLRELLKEYGINVLNIAGCHYVMDGIFHKLINADKLKDRNYRRRVFKLEKICQEDPALKNLARAWLAIGKKK